MAIAEQPRLTVAEFLALPEEEPELELEADGTITQKVSPKGRHSALQFALAKLFDRAAKPKRRARVFTELRATFAGASVVPDLSVYLWDRVPVTPDGLIADNFLLPPDLAVEIVSPEQSVNALVRRCIWYVENQVQVALLVDPKDQSIIRFRAGAEPRPLVAGDLLDVSEVLPDLHVTVDEVFAALRMS
jgi:Uma2 family endonuclease